MLIGSLWRIPSAKTNEILFYYNFLFPELKYTYLSNRSKKPRPDIYVLDEWDILSQRIQLLEELGEGAFGKVHRAILTEKTSIQGPTAQSNRKSKRQKIVAVKTMHGTYRFLSYKFYFFQP